ncbi:MAG: hypothetical protein LBD65_06690, partial [Spirochaetaceae bacterium]|nr:hypothetical protein [Spirochaetaceae bacterium]
APAPSAPSSFFSIYARTPFACSSIPSPSSEKAVPSLPFSSRMITRILPFPFVRRDQFPVSPLRRFAFPPGCSLRRLSQYALYAS